MQDGRGKRILYIIVLCLLSGITQSLWAQTNVTRYLRFESNGAVGYGILDGRTIHDLRTRRTQRGAESREGGLGDDRR